MIYNKMNFTSSEIKSSNFQQIASLTGFTSGAPVIFDLPAQPGGLLDLRRSKLIVSFTLGSSMTREDTLGWMAGLLAFSSCRLYLNGRDVGIEGNFVPFAAFHRAIFQRSETVPALRGWKADDIKRLEPPEQQISGITSPWRLPNYIEYTAGSSQAEFSYNNRGWSGAMYDGTHALNNGQTCQLAIPLDLVFPFCDDGRLLDNSVTSIRLELFPSNTAFSPCKTADALTLTPSSASFWARRVQLTDAGWQRYQSTWAEQKVLKYPINLFPATTTFRLPAGITTYNASILASGSRPAQLVVHLCQAASLNLSSWVATQSIGPPVVPSHHVYQCAQAATAPVVQSMIARTQTKIFPQLYTLSRYVGTEGGSAIIDYEQYVESTKMGTTRDTNLRPFVPFSAYTDPNGCQLFTINLLDNDQSTWDADRTGERVSLDLQINFASVVLAGDLMMAVTVLGHEEVQISQSGNIGKTY